MAKYVTDERIPENILTPPPGLLSCSLDKITVTKRAKVITSFDIIQTVNKFGMDYYEYTFNIFRLNKQGNTRRWDGQDLISGYPYGQGEVGVKNLISTMSDALEFRSHFEANCTSEVLWDTENEDFKKISILRPTFLGRHLQPPISLEFKPVIFPPDFITILRKVLDKYTSSSTYVKTGMAAILDGTDAPDTAVGSPTFYSGDATHAVRLATLYAIPPPDYSHTPEDYMAKLDTFGGQFLPDPSILYSSYLSFRQGATNKPTPLWMRTGSGFSATHDSTGIYTRQRAVWAAPFWLNVIITPLVLRMKSARQHILGMWHDPEHYARYITRLQSQGHKAIEVDYSSYDSTIANSLMAFCYREMAKRGFASWESEFMALITERAGAITPSFTGATDSVSMFKHNVSLMSGLLTTSEIGSLISISIVLYALSKQKPHLVDEWISGKFVILVQSDDVLFTYSGDAIDEEQFAADCAKLGITAKVKAGSTFLKRILPIGTFSKLTKPFSRNLQQTIGNEDRYDGRPPALLRLGLAARNDLLQNHPMFKTHFPKLLSMYEAHFDYVKDANLKDWLSGKFTLSDSDMRAIQQYADSKAGSSLLTSLIERSKFDPSALNVLQYMTSIGLTLDHLIMDQVKARGEYTKALFAVPPADSLSKLIQFCKWAEV